MASIPRPRRHRALLLACDRLESRELLSGTSSHDVHPVASPHVEFARQTSEHARKFHGPIIGNLNPVPNASFSTVPPNGDVNPYGVAVVPNGFPSGGTTQPGDVLVSNWNNSGNIQGTGTTIVSISPGGSQSVFYQAPQGSGLTTALGVLKRGFVIVGNVPATYTATSAAPDQGSLMILDKSGNQVANLTNGALLDGPWDLTVNDQGNHAQVFVSNVVSATVTRIDLKIHGSQVVVQDMVQIGSGYGVRPDPAALIVGPTGLAFDPKKDVLYVASTDDNGIYAISNALHTRADRGKGRLVFQDQANLRGPLGLTLAPNGDLLTTNGDAVNPDPAQASELVEFTPKGQFVGQLQLDPAQGAAFGLQTVVSGNVLTLFSVDDATNTLDMRNISS
jgi:hypothetical protein